MEKITLEKMTPSRILYHITEKLKDTKEYTYLIMGRPGPTGKTWLAEGLKDHGYNALDISENLCWHILNYTTDRNHFEIDPNKKLAIIVLNESLRKDRFEEKKKKEKRNERT